MAVIPFTPRKKDDKEAEAKVPATSPTFDEVMRDQSLAMMKAALVEATRMGISIPNTDEIIKDSLLGCEAMRAFLMRIHGQEHSFHKLSDNSFERQDDGTFKFWPPNYSD